MSIERNGNQFVFENEWIRRVLDISAGPVTTQYRVRPYGAQGAPDWHTLMFEGMHFPYEATVTIDGVELEAGPVSPPQGYTREGAFTVAESRIERWALGERLVLICRPRVGGMPEVELTLRYDLADELPLLVRSMSVRNMSSASVRLNGMVVEVLPDSKYDYAHEIFTFTDYYEQYGTIRFPEQYYRTWTRHQFPTDLNLVLAPGAEAESFRLFEYTAPNEENARAIVHHRIFKALTPWTQNQPVQQQVNGAESIEALRRIIDRAADLGIEMIHCFVSQLFTNCGDFVFRPDLFPKGAEDAKAFVDYAHARGVKVLPYTGLTIAWQEMSWGVSSQVWKDHPDWQYLGPDGIRYLSVAFGNMCYQSGWGDYIQEKFRWLLDEIGFDGIHIDGPYHWLPCLAKDHKHKTPESVYYMNWAWERDFFGAMAKRGAYITVPQDPGAILMGACYRPGGYTEEDYTVMDGMPLVSVTRACLYDAQAMLPSCCRWAFVNVDKYHGHHIEADEEHPATYEHAIASCFGLGHAGLLHAGERLILGPRTEAILRKWIDRFCRRRRTLEGDTVRLLRPDGRHPDAVLHLNGEADVPGVLVIFNPSAEEAEVQLVLPLGYAGFGVGDGVRIEGKSVGVCDSRGQCALSLTLEPQEVKWVEIERS